MKRVALINDLSGFGRCALGVALPIVSAFGLECCMLPTAILSNHTGFDKYSFVDFTEHMGEFIDQWRAHQLEIDTVYTGFLGSARQIDYALELFELAPGALRLVDPVMGDGGKAYSTYTDELVARMGGLVRHANVITPNFTELCMLCGLDYNSRPFTADTVLKSIEGLCRGGPQYVALTGVTCDKVDFGDKNSLINFLYRADGGRHETVINQRVPVSYCGTGDLFASVLCGSMTRGDDFFDAAALAVRFCERCTKITWQNGGTQLYGIQFEGQIINLSKGEYDSENQRERG